MRNLLLSAVVLLSSGAALAHSGGTDGYGCHVNHALEDGDSSRYHCHKGCYKGKKFSSKAEGISFINAHGSIARDAVCKRVVANK